MTRKRLQVHTPDGWVWVFCRNPLHGVITTTKREKAQPAYALDYFRQHFADHQFRLR